jgi:hypothetical protein
MAFSHNHNIGGLYGQKYYRPYCYYLPEMSINGAAIIFAIALWKIQRVAPQH